MLKTLFIVTNISFDEEFKHTYLTTLFNTLTMMGLLRHWKVIINYLSDTLRSLDIVFVK